MLPSSERLDWARGKLDEKTPPRERFIKFVGKTEHQRLLAETIWDRNERGEAIELPAELFSAGVDWTTTIKVIRQIRGCSVEEAQAMTLSDPAWLRWCKQRIKTDLKCLKQAHFAAREGLLPEWIGMKGGQPVFLK